MDRMGTLDSVDRVEKESIPDVCNDFREVVACRFCLC
jgi:hypothetical protein